MRKKSAYQSYRRKIKRIHEQEHRKRIWDRSPQVVEVRRNLRELFTLVESELEKKAA